MSRNQENSGRNTIKKMNESTYKNSMNSQAFKTMQAVLGGQKFKVNQRKRRNETVMYGQVERNKAENIERAIMRIQQIQNDQDLNGKLLVSDSIVLTEDEKY